MTGRAKFDARQLAIVAATLRAVVGVQVAAGLGAYFLPDETSLLVLGAPDRPLGLLQLSIMESVGLLLFGIGMVDLFIFEKLLRAWRAPGERQTGP